MSFIENTAVGGCIAAALVVSVHFLNEGNKLRKEGHQKEGKIVMAAGSAISVFGIANLVLALRK